MRDKEDFIIVLGVIAVLGAMFVLGFHFGIKSSHETSTKKTPIIQIETINGKSDTTYIYKF